MAEIRLADNLERLSELVPVGSKRLVKAGREKICLVHLSEGFVAFKDACPHMGEGLHKGHINKDQEIVCPWHSYRFSMKNGECSQSDCGPLQFYEIRHERDGVFLTR